MNNGEHAKLKNNNDPFVVNQHVDFSFTKLIDQNGTFHEGVPIGKAKQMAQDCNLDLVCFSLKKDNNLPLCKIIDYGKWKYNEEKKKKQINKENKKKDTKEIRFSLGIDKNDIGHKIKRAIEFLESGDDVIFTMRLKGREKAHFVDGIDKMNEILCLCKEHGKESSRKINKDVGTITARLTKI